MVTRRPTLQVTRRPATVSFPHRALTGARRHARLHARGGAPLDRAGRRARRQHRQEVAGRVLTAAATVVNPHNHRATVPAHPLPVNGPTLVRVPANWFVGGMQRSRWSVGSAWSAGSVASIGSAASVLSALSLCSAGSLLSIGSSGSILSVGSSGSVLSIGSSGSFLSIGGRSHRAAGDDGPVRTLGARDVAVVRAIGTTLGLLAVGAAAATPRSA